MDGMEFESFSRDLLRRFGRNASSGETPEPGAFAGGGDGDNAEIELSLGLSLGGCFGDKVEGKEKKLLRSSSIASFSSFPKREQQEFPVIPASMLTRTSSLPVESEEEWRARKELEGMKRLEAKRKRLERKNSMNSVKAAAKSDDDNNNNSLVVNGGVRRWMPRPRRTRQVSASSSQNGEASAAFRPVSQGSLGSQGSTSACGLPEFDIRAPQGLTTSTLDGCTESSRLSMGLNSNNLSINSAANSVNGQTRSSLGEDESSKKDRTKVNGVLDLERNMMAEMPSVSTKGEGPNGRKIEGFLYKYKKGEKLQIVCLCHGSFLTPAEFVKHAGGGDVAHPLKHIVVNPPPEVL